MILHVVDTSLQNHKSGVPWHRRMHRTMTACSAATTSTLGFVPRYVRVCYLYPHAPATKFQFRSRPFVTFSSTGSSPSHHSRRSMSGTTAGHYESHTADSYEKAYFYSPGKYTDYLRDTVKQALRLQSSSSSSSSSSSATRRRLIDIGGGTGNFTRMILEDVPNMEGVVIDPFLESGGSNARSAGDDIQFVKASAQDFAQTASSSNGDEWWKSGYHCILMKEVVHHFPYDARSDIFRGMRSGLANLESNGPSLLIVTRPDRSLDYPLWPAARKVWAANQPSASDIMLDLEAAGFQDVQSKVQTYPASIKLDRWLDMVQSRFWSTFAKFSDAELEAACDLIREEAQSKTDGDGIVHFEDRLVFITAR